MYPAIITARRRGMKVVSVLLGLINFLAGALLILSCIAAQEPFAWIAWKTGAGSLAVTFSILTFRDASQRKAIVYGLLLVIAGVAILAFGIHWSIVSGNPKNTVMLVGGSFTLHGVTSVLGAAEG
jgi:cytochrome c biogenesis factor